MLRWTPERVAQLQSLISEGHDAAEIGIIMGATAGAIYQAAWARGFRFHDFTGKSDAGRTAKTRRRWRELIGPMKAALRAEVAALCHDKVS